MPATSANLVHVDDFGSLIRKPMYCVRVQQAVVGRVVLLTFIPEKNSLFGWLSNFTGHCQCVSPKELKNTTPRNLPLFYYSNARCFTQQKWKDYKCHSVYIPKLNHLSNRDIKLSILLESLRGCPQILVLNLGIEGVRSIHNRPNNDIRNQGHSIAEMLPASLQEHTK